MDLSYIIIFDSTRATSKLSLGFSVCQALHVGALQGHSFVLPFVCPYAYAASVNEVLLVKVI